MLQQTNKRNQSGSPFKWVTAAARHVTTHSRYQQPPLRDHDLSQAGPTDTEEQSALNGTAGDGEHESPAPEHDRKEDQKGEQQPHGDPAADEGALPENDATAGKKQLEGSEPEIEASRTKRYSKQQRNVAAKV
ncbi:hypothetical protein BST61_g9775 [Cercospora zeina]